MKKRFRKELKKNIVYGYFAIAIVLIFMAGYYFKSVEKDFDNQCSSCVTQECMDNDIKCGDFGEYYFKFFSLITMGAFGVMLLSMLLNKEVEVNGS